MVLEMPNEDDVHTGRALSGGWMLNKLLTEAGLDRASMLIVNTLRCRFGTNEYPKGSLRKNCEIACRHWDELSLTAFKPTVWSVMFDPLAIPKIPQTEEYVVKHLSLMRTLVERGEKPVILAGTKVMECFAPWLKGGAGTWKNHWWQGTNGSPEPQTLRL